MSSDRANRGATAGGRLLLLAGAVGVLGGLAVFWATESSETVDPPGASAAVADRAAPGAAGPTGRPLRPPVQGRDEPFSLPQPEPPPDMNQIRERAYENAVAQKVRHPAEVAFRKATDAFVEHNRQLADAQAQAEGLTLGEVKELTHFGFLAQQSQRWPDVEDVLGHPLDEATRTAAEQMLNEMNVEFKAAMRSLVESGGTENERWQLIHDVQARYREAYFATTGMNEALLQDLLAGDLARKYPMSQTPPPEVLAEQGPPPEEPEPRPESEPPPAPPPEDEARPEGEPTGADSVPPEPELDEG